MDLAVEKLNVYQKINEVKKVVKTFKKDAETTGKGAYTYTSGTQVLSAIKDKMEELGLLFLPVETKHRDWTTYNYTNASGYAKTDFIVTGELVYEWIDADNPVDRQRVSFEYYGQQNDISKAFGSGLTYSERYLLLKSLGVPTDEDDPDKTSGDKPQEEKPKTKYQQIKAKCKEKNVSIDSVEEYIKGKAGADVRINDLTDEQFNKVMDMLEKQSEKQTNS